MLNDATDIIWSVFQMTKRLFYQASVFGQMLGNSIADVVHQLKALIFCYKLHIIKKQIKKSVQRLERPVKMLV